MLAATLNISLFRLQNSEEDF